jgi:hypothetical protein
MAFLSTCFFASVFIALIVMHRKASKENEAEASASESDGSRPTA